MESRAMNWLSWPIPAIATLIIGYLYGIFVGARNARNSLQPVIRQQDNSSAVDRDHFFGVLRRELANWMLRTDPDRYLQTYRQAHQTATEIRAATRVDQMTTHAELCEKYPHYGDFDLIGTRDHILYEDAFENLSYAEVESRYLDIIRFHALKAVISDEWAYFKTTTSEDLTRIEEYSQRFKDRRFRHRLEQALREYLNFIGTKKGLFAFGEEYDNIEFNVRRIEHMVESRLGFHFKNSDEFGIYSVFYYDDHGKDGRVSAHKSFYRCSSVFDRETSLSYSALPG
jgi:hypothetical protein